MKAPRRKGRFERLVIDLRHLQRLEEQFLMAEEDLLTRLQRLEEEIAADKAAKIAVASELSPSKQNKPNFYDDFENEDDVPELSFLEVERAETQMLLKQFMDASRDILLRKRYLHEQVHALAMVLAPPPGSTNSNEISQSSGRRSSVSIHGAAKATGNEKEKKRKSKRSRHQEGMAVNDRLATSRSNYCFSLFLQSQVFQSLRRLLETMKKVSDEIGP